MSMTGFVPKAAMKWAFFQWPETKNKKNTPELFGKQLEARTLASASEVWEPKFWPTWDPTIETTKKGWPKRWGGCQAGSLSTLLGFAVVLESWDITDVPTSDGEDDANATVTTTTVSTTFTYSISTTSSTTDPNSTTVAASAVAWFHAVFIRVPFGSLPAQCVPGIAKLWRSNMRVSGIHFLYSLASS